MLTGGNLQLAKRSGFGTANMRGLAVLTERSSIRADFGDDSPSASLKI